MLQCIRGPGCKVHTVLTRLGNNTVFAPPTNPHRKAPNNNTHNPNTVSKWSSDPL